MSVLLPRYIAQNDLGRGAYGGVGRGISLDAGAGPARAVEELGQTVTAIGVDQLRHMKAAEAEDFVASNSAALSSRSLDILTKARETAAPDAANFTAGTLTEFDKATADALKQAPSGTARRALQQNALGLRRDLEGRASSYEVQARSQHFVNNAKTANDAYASALLVAPDRYESSLQQQVDHIDKLPLDTADKETLKQNTWQSLGAAALEGWARHDPHDFVKRAAQGDFDHYGTPEALRVSIDRADSEIRRQQNEASVQRWQDDQDQIRLDPKAAAAGFRRRADLASLNALASAVGDAESGGRADAVSPKGALGKMQVMPDTAREVATGLQLPEAGLSDADFHAKLLSDPDLNQKLGSTYLAQQLDKYGGNRMLAVAAYNAGPGKVDEWIAKNGDPRTGAISDADFVAAIPFKETRDYVGRVLERAGPEDRELRMAQRQAEVAAATESRAQTGLKQQNELALLAHGEAPPEPITRDEFNAGYLPEQVAKADLAWSHYSGLRAKAAIIGQIAGKPFSVQQQAIASLKPDPSSDDYAEQVTMLEAGQQALAEDQKVRATDPAGYVEQHDPEVRAALQASLPSPNGTPPSPAAFSRYIAASLDAQERLEIPEGQRRPLPKPIAESAVAKFKSAQSVEDRVAALAPVTLGLVGPDGKTDDTLARKALDQLEAAGLPAGADRALEAYRQGDATRGQLLMGAIAVDNQNLPDPGEVKKADVSREVARLYDSSTLNLAQAEANTWAATGQPGNARLATRGRELLKKVALLEAAKPGVDAATAAANALHLVYGDGEVAGSSSLGVVAVPAGTDTEAFSTGLTNLRAGLDLSHLAPTEAGIARLLPPGSSPGAVQGALQMALRDHGRWEQSVRDGAHWIGAPNGYQLALGDGQIVSDAAGKPRVWSATDVLQAAKQVAADEPSFDPLTGVQIGGGPPHSLSDHDVQAIKAGTARPVVTIPTPFGVVTVGHGDPAPAAEPAQPTPPAADPAPSPAQADLPHPVTGTGELPSPPEGASAPTSKAADDAFDHYVERHTEASPNDLKIWRNFRGLSDDQIAKHWMFKTSLTPEQETRFEAWKKKYAPHDDGYDYDFRGAFKAGVTPDPKSGHWPDTFKKPNHPTFSDQSQYYILMPWRAGRWTGAEGETYQPPAGRRSS